ncbi:gapN, partial [Symbiodinium necroappetens]
PSEQPLSGTAETLSAWRVEIEERAEYLGTFASECEEEVHTFEGQISSSTAAMKVELETLQAERASVARRADGLRMRREELLAQLLEVEEELKGVESADAELDHRESQLKSSMGRVSKALSTQREASQENGLVAACRHRVLLGTVAASRQVEELVAKRAAAAADSTHPGKKLSAQQKKVRSATLESDKTRYRELQDLISSWQDQIWGPGSGALVSNTAAAAALQAAHLQAVSLVEDAQKEADEIAAAECGNLGLEGFWGLASPFAKSSIRRQMSRSAAGYKVMREQLCENLERLAELQCAATVRTRCGSLTSASTGHHGFGFSEGQPFLPLSYTAAPLFLRSASKSWCSLGSSRSAQQWLLLGSIALWGCCRRSRQPQGWTEYKRTSPFQLPVWHACRCACGNMQWHSGQDLQQC